jgi:hypothetical protein
MTTKADRRRKEQAKGNCIQAARIERGADPRTHQRRISVIIMTIVTSAAAHTISNLVSQSASGFSFVGTPTAECLHETTSFYCFLGQPAPDRCHSDRKGRIRPSVGVMHAWTRMS